MKHFFKYFIFNLKYDAFFKHFILFYLYFFVNFKFFFCIFKAQDPRHQGPIQRAHQG
jgi:hypothetical protein